MFRGFAFAAALTMAGLAIPGGAQASVFDRFSDTAVFGDSLSDPFNPLLPPTFYPNQQVTNGDTWAVQLGFDDPATENFAKSSARAISSTESDFDGQIAAFKGLSKTLGDAALALVWFGGNDVGDAVTAELLASGGIARLNQALTAMAKGLDDLAKEGFDKALVFLVPDIGATPRLQEIDLGFPGAAALASGYTSAYNTGLLNISASMTETLELGFVNVPGLVAAATADPASFGFTNTTDACVANFSMFVNGCSASTANEFIYYDNFHPSERAHGLIADLASQEAVTLAPVPLPAAGVFLVLALGGLGVIRARRHAA